MITTEKFNEIFDETMAKCSELLGIKANDYAEGDDRLHNFMIAGDLADCSPIKAVQGMMLKHVVSVNDYINRYEDGADISMEQWDEKILDNINYLILLRAAVIDDSLLYLKKMNEVKQDGR